MCFSGFPGKRGLLFHVVCEDHPNIYSPDNCRTAAMHGSSTLHQLQSWCIIAMVNDEAIRSVF